MFKKLQQDLEADHHIHFNNIKLLEEALTQANYVMKYKNTKEEFSKKKKQ